MNMTILIISFIVGWIMYMAGDFNLSYVEAQFRYRKSINNIPSGIEYLGLTIMGISLLLMLVWKIYKLTLLKWD